jgi:3-oxoadipate enol-lactonase
MHSSFRTTDGISIAYYVDDFTDPWQRPPTLLMLHSAMGHSRRFYAMVPPFLRSFRVVRMDMRGHGESEVPGSDSTLTMDRLVADVSELLDHLGVDSAHVLGNSAGGYLGQNLAMSSPARVRTLSLFGSTAGLKNSQAASWLPRVEREGLRNFLADTIADRFPLDRTDAGLIEWFLDEAAKNDVPFIARFIGLMTTLDWSDQLHRIACPTLVVMPGAETVGSTKNYDVMRDRIPDVKVVALEGLPHNICDSAPDLCSAEALNFLSERGAIGGDARRMS